MKYQNILISRIDAIGDVILTIPLCGYLKTIFPESTILFLGKSYTQPVISSCSSIDQFINYDELKSYSEKEQISFMKDRKIDVFIHVFPNRHLASLAKKSRIPLRIGTSHRLYHWFSCNKLINLGRKNSNLHESELNLKLLEGLGIKKFPVLPDIHRYYNLTNIVSVPANILKLLCKDKFNLVLHPKSHGSGKEWQLDRYKELIHILPKDKYVVFISGSEKEKDVLKDWIPTIGEAVIDVTGLMTLAELMSFIKLSDGLLASSTGPLHLAAALEINALGLYPNVRPINAERWGPIGKRAGYLKSGNAELDSIQAIDVYKVIQTWSKLPL